MQGPADWIHQRLQQGNVGKTPTPPLSRASLLKDAVSQELRLARVPLPPEHAGDPVSSARSDATTRIIAPASGPC